MKEATLFAAYAGAQAPGPDRAARAAERLADQLEALDQPVLARIAHYLCEQIEELSREVAHTH